MAFVIRHIVQLIELESVAQPGGKFYNFKKSAVMFDNVLTELRSQAILLASEMNSSLIVRPLSPILRINEFHIILY